MENRRKYYFSLLVIGSMFFALGFLTWLNSILMPFLQQLCDLTVFQSSFVPFAFYIAYFVMAIPSSLVLKKIGYANGMGVGLLIMALGALLFVPAAISRDYLIFLSGLFTIGIGLCLVQTAVNPYATFIGPIESAARRISIMGISNKVAGMIGVFVLSGVLFKNSDEILGKLTTITDPLIREPILQSLSYRIIIPYIIIAIILLLLVVFVKMSKLPEIKEDSVDTVNNRSIFSYKYLWLGVLAIFFYVGAEVVSIDYLAHYGMYLGIPSSIASSLSIYALFALLIGYFVGVAFTPKYISQRKAFIIQLILAVLLVFAIIFTSGWISIACVILLSFAHALMWPTIWPLSIHDLGSYTKLGSAILVMAICGGAIISLLYGRLADVFNPQIAYAILFISYAYLLFFATKGYKMGRK